MEERDNPYAAPEAPDANQNPRPAPTPRLPLTGFQKAGIALAVVVVAIWLLAMGHGLYVRIFLGD